MRTLRNLSLLKMGNLRVVLYLLLLVGFLGFSVAETELFIQSLAKKATVAEAQKTTVVSGKDGWLFFAPELRHLSVGQFWGEAAARVSRASNPEFADPLPAILDFKAQLDKAGIALIFVPIPAKATIYPEMVSEHGTGTETRTDKYHQKFYDILRKQGVNVLDLTPIFLKNRFTDTGPVYCKQDTHWSGRGCVLAAEAIAEAIGTPSWVAEIPKRNIETETRTTEITGDLWKELGDEKLQKEQLQLTYVKEGVSASWRASPVVLLGDSHSLVFHAGSGMHAQGAGLPDHLAHQFGFPVDVVAVRGSGATPSRLNLYRRRDNMKGKRVVVWCLSVREFTEGQGWRKVPVIR
ncbi:hypothetical protein C6499_20445 [Candidatus Poribacteria bacterium]|nr:MAG: hypothetical protein C6499_20445 [Candidatus Poribacteria bacterium]